MGGVVIWAPEGTHVLAVRAMRDVGGHNADVLAPSPDGFASARDGLLERARSGGVGDVLVADLVSLSRTGVHDLLGFLGVLCEVGVRVRSLAEPWADTADVNLARFLARQGAWVALVDPEIRSRGIKEGLARRRAAGLQVGGRRPGVGNKNAAQKAVDRGKLVRKAARLVIERGSGSEAMLRRELRIGYKLAVETLRELEVLGVVGPKRGREARVVLATKPPRWRKSVPPPNH